MGATSILYGFSHSAFLAKKVGLTKSLIIIHNHPKEYIKAVGAETFLDHDLCAAAVIESEKPFFWHKIPHYDNLTAEQQRLYDLDVKFNMNIGLSVSLPFGAGKGIGGFGMCCAGMTPQELEARWAVNSGEVLIRLKSFDSVMRPLMVSNRIRLSPREREVLAYSSAGLTAKEISHQMKIETKTVYNTLERARKSLKAATTMEAIAKAYIYDIL
jgi:DNA-binding CsgD family transcriptional regulator